MGDTLGVVIVKDWEIENKRQPHVTGLTSQKRAGLTTALRHVRSDIIFGLDVSITQRSHLIRKLFVHRTRLQLDIGRTSGNRGITRGN